MIFRPIDPDAVPLHLVDDSTGIEFFEKNAEQRVRRWIQGDDDSRQRGVTFVVRDPRWTGTDGGHDVEFGAVGRARIIESKSDRSSEVFKTEVIYGFDVPVGEFARKFSLYTGGDNARLAEVRDWVTTAILLYLGGVPDTVVEFI